jgi:flagellar biosynthetic protein FlhB
MAESAGEKSQDPTPHRRQQAREEGQVVHSQDLAAAALLTVGLLVLVTMSGPAIVFFENFTRQQLGDAWLAIDRDEVTLFWWASGWEMAKAVLPLLGVLLLAAILAHLFQVGFLFLPQRLMPDLSRINPLAGVSRIFSLASLMQLLFGCFKIVIVAGVAWWSLSSRQEELLGLATLALPQIAAFMTDVLLWTSIKVCVALFILALMDYLYQFWRQERQLRMTPQEVREEMKNLQGNPEVISRRRNVQRQLAMNRLKSAVPKADVVITNPTELAVAIQYEIETMAAPVVVAKGAGVIAAQIRRLALAGGIPIVEKKPLAQALYKEVELNHPIPDKLYAAVAEVLAYVYQLKGKPLRANDER